MVFYLIGIGLGDIEDITVKGFKIVKKCEKVYLDSYTSILSYGLDRKKLEEFYGKEIIDADRDTVEQASGQFFCVNIFNRAKCLYFLVKLLAVICNLFFME